MSDEQCWGCARGQSVDEYGCHRGAPETRGRFQCRSRNNQLWQCWQAWLHMMGIGE